MPVVLLWKYCRLTKSSWQGFSSHPQDREFEFCYRCEDLIGVYYACTSVSAQKALRFFPTRWAPRDSTRLNFLSPKTFFEIIYIVVFVIIEYNNIMTFLFYFNINWSQYLMELVSTVACGDILVYQKRDVSCYIVRITFQVEFNYYCSEVKNLAIFCQRFLIEFFVCFCLINYNELDRF